MKKLLSLPLLALSIAASSQQLEGVNQEHLLVSSNATNAFIQSKEELKVRRIALKTGVTLDYVEKGAKTGTPVIFLHGICDSWHSFEGVLSHLPSSIRAFAITQRGHGDSEKPAEGYTPKEFAADVAAFIQQKGLGSAIIVGHSMGGVHTQQFAIRYPALAKAIVIVDSDASFIDNPGMPEFYRDVMKLEGKISWEFMDGFQKATLAKPIDSAFYRVLVEEGTKTPARVFQAAFKGLLQVDFAPQLKSVKCPAMIIWGDKDAFCFRKGQDVMAKNIKQAKLVIYEGVGHSPHWEEPQRFTSDLVQFVHSLQSSSHGTKAKK